jgi:murein DD-endopeptidase MepM/ murein hydrolase activator NlpD
VAFAAVGRRIAFASDTLAVEEAASVPAAENDGGTPPADAPAADAPPADTPPVTESAAAPPPVAPKSYTVATGDTMFSIAKRHGVSVDAVLWANNLTDANTLKQGQKLVIPPSTGKLHTVKDGDTIDSLASTYSVSKAGIATVNGLAEDAGLKAGQRLLIPAKAPSGDPAFAPASVPVTAASTDEPVPISSGATGSPTPPVLSSLATSSQTPGFMTATGATVKVTNKTIQKMAWPVTLGAAKTGVSQGFRPGHTGIDIYAPQGTEIKAAAAGTIKMAEKNPDGFSGYGWIVIVDHGDGVSSWYAHCGSFAVKEGDKVRVGDKIGTVGMTGRTTGPHLHFEVRVAMSAVDPRLVLP